MSQQKTEKKKISDTVVCLSGVGTALNAVLPRALGMTFPWVEACRAGAWLSHGSDGLKADAVLQWVFG